MAVEHAHPTRDTPGYERADLPDYSNVCAACRTERLVRTLGFYMDDELDRPLFGLPSTAERALSRILADAEFRAALMTGNDFRRVQVYNGDGIDVLDVLVLASEAEMLKEFLELTTGGDVYVDPVPNGRLPVELREPS